ncbi:hypothetical protein CYLTODRAFT_456010 [Cylindrobasidium torrendii FP15055 ss-10]|uniref:Arrestin-like N-terminal domain-containing protein n=1 Tax=Cylindrobasidium torrendii FP15055 ss-10 TaxID=1314674 RepID=A0A0D7B5B9_9AGAR|nr:hypothetical protein CYLTODRAFT_456010 [Cylindrobasidium torrendii FP15055 ss-10]
MFDMDQCVLGSTASTGYLPTYTSLISPPPGYSPYPAFGEGRLEHSPRRDGEYGTFILKRGSITIVLDGQLAGATQPEYGRQGKVTGAIFIDSHDSVVSVSTKLLGRLDYVTANGGPSIKTVALENTLWSGDSDRQCPSAIPLSFEFPETYRHCREEHPLPPSFEYGIPTYLTIQSVYSLVVSVSYIRRCLRFVPKRKTVTIPLRYLPRARARHPLTTVPPSHGIKSSPDEWKQIVRGLVVKPHCSVMPSATMIVLIPSAHIFSQCESIPIHVQISGIRLHLHFVSAPKVSLIRQITVEIRGERTSRMLPIGDGRILSIPSASDDVLDWEGKLCVNSNMIRAGAFVASGVSVRDFIQVTLYPPIDSSFQMTQMHIPVRLATHCD